jgi:hypothetical protein
MSFIPVVRLNLYPSASIVEAEMAELQISIGLVIILGVSASGVFMALWSYLRRQHAN